MSIHQGTNIYGTRGRAGYGANSARPCSHMLRSMVPLRCKNYEQPHKCSKIHTKTAHTLHLSPASNTQTHCWRDTIGVHNADMSAQETTHAVPGVGVRLLVQQQTSAQAAAAQRRRLNPRHAASIAAFQALGVHRQLPHSSMTAQQIHLEPVVGNHSVANAVTGGLFSNVSSVPGHVQPRAAGVTLGQVAANLTFQLAVDGMVLPTEWQQTLMQPAQPQPEWVADTQSRWA